MLISHYYTQARFPFSTTEGDHRERYAHSPSGFFGIKIEKQSKGWGTDKRQGKPKVGGHLSSSSAHMCLIVPSHLERVICRYLLGSVFKPFTVNIRYFNRKVSTLAENSGLTNPFYR